MSDMRQRKKRMSTTYEVVSTGGGEEVYGSGLLMPQGKVPTSGMEQCQDLEGPGRGTPSCGGQLGGYGPLTLQFQLVSVERLLSTILKVIARMVLW